MRQIEAVSYGKIAWPEDSDFGPAPQLEWIKISKLRVDPAYQREIGEKGARNVRKIVEHFDWSKFSPVIVSPVAGGAYAIVDGQHRSTAALMCGIEEVPCQIIIADQKRQAESFGAINSATTQLTGYAIYRAALAAGDEGALKVKACTTAAGVEIVGNAANPTAQAHHTSALASIQRAVKQDASVAELALRCVVISSKGLKGYLAGQIINAVSEVLFYHPEFAGHPQLQKAFGGFDLLEQLTIAKGKKKPGLSPSSVLIGDLTDYLAAKLGFAKPSVVQTAAKSLAAAAAIMQSRPRVTPPAPAAYNHGDPAPGRSALDQRQAAK